MTWHVHYHITCVILDSGHIWPQEEPSAYLHLPWSSSQGRRRQTASFHWGRLGTKVVLKWCCVPRIATVLWWPEHHIIIIIIIIITTMIIIIITTMITSSWLISTITRLAEGVQMKELPFPPTIPQAASNALLAATVSLLLALFLALACVEDKQLPANEVSQDRSPMRLAEGSTDHGGFGWWFRMILEGGWNMLKPQKG